MCMMLAYTTIYLVLLRFEPATAFTQNKCGRVSGLSHRFIEIPMIGSRLRNQRTSYNYMIHFSRADSEGAQVPSTTNPSTSGGNHAVGATLGSGLVPPFSVTLDDATAYSYKSAINRTLLWVLSALAFGSGLWLLVDPQLGEEFFAGYLVEQSLSVDNLFVFLLLFEYFKVPLQYQDRVLNWGIYGAVVMRAIMIGLGVAALENFRGVLLVFAAILVYGSAKFFIVADDDEDEDPNDNKIIQLTQRLIKSTDEFDADRFFTIKDGLRMATPLFICMISVEISDIVFAIDSIPAVFGVTENPLVIFSSNIFAIMGLRSLYTILSKAAADLKYLEPAVAVVLGFIGAKMIAEYFEYQIPTNIALVVVASLLGTGVGASIIEKKYKSKQMGVDEGHNADSN